EACERSYGRGHPVHWLAVSADDLQPEDDAADGCPPELPKDGPVRRDGGHEQDGHVEYDPHQDRVYQERRHTDPESRPGKPGLGRGRVRRRGKGAAAETTGGTDAERGA